MKKISAIRNIPYLTIILLTLICIMLLSSKNMIMSQASYPEATIVSSAYAVVEGSDSDKEEITFPHTFKHLSPRTHVTVTTHINLNKDDPIYIKLSIPLRRSIWTMNSYMSLAGPKTIHPI